MLIRAAIVALALLATGCSANHELINCEGTPIALNPNDWHPSQDEMNQIVHSIEAPQ
jgi:hypothetical protein